ncbi:hypothetical protein BDQ12DRAFT_460895 [Crucibulum laeve]|uniref:Uncharacterized protein n=1 Tax=Crucibulum laeve TaxID=68775 RepID=A0A5C3M9Z1_9AGAR|nr:hypothetical protein BDQ12DRAFT_460895 [Crucibulum laeve]
MPPFEIRFWAFVLQPLGFYGDFFFFLVSLPLSLSLGLAARPFIYDPTFIFFIVFNICNLHADTNAALQSVSI